MSKRVEYYQLVEDRDSVSGVQWPSGSGVFAARHDFQLVIEKENVSYVLFWDSHRVSTRKAQRFIDQLRTGGLTCVLVDLESASNPISQRKPAMNKVRRK